MYDTSVVTCVEADNSPIDTDNIENITMYSLSKKSGVSLEKRIHISQMQV